MPHPNVVGFMNDQFWAITDDKRAEIESFIEKADLGTLQEEYKAQLLEPNAQLVSSDINELYAASRVEMHDKVAVLPLTGTIMPKANLITKYSGGTSTAQFASTVTALENDPAVRAVVFRVDSPGGSTTGLSEARAAIRSMTKPTVTVADGMMASAAYWLGSSAERVYAAHESVVGSIGVVMSRLDVSEAAKAAGVKRVVIRSGPYKMLGMAEEPINDKERAQKQALVDGMYANFFNAVKENRNLSQDDTVSIADGNIYIASQAIDNNMIDGIKTVDAIVAELNEDATAADNLNAFQASAKASETQYLAAISEKDARIAELEQAQATNAKAQAEAKADEFVASLVADNKIAPKADTAPIRKAAIADYEGTAALYALVPAGASSPGSIELDPNATDARTSDAEMDAKVAKAKAEGKLVATDADMAEVFTAAGAQFIKTYE